MQVSSFNDGLYTGSSSIARFLGLPHLASHLPTVVASFFLWNAVQYVISPLVLSRFTAKQANPDQKNMLSQAPGSNSTLKDKPDPKRAKGSLNAWHTRVVSMIHAIIVVPLAFKYLTLPGLSEPRERAFGWEERIGSLHGIACGYFLWDIVDAVLHFESVGFVLHGIACLAVFGLSYRPFLAYYGPRFLLWELSTPFLNLNWFFERSYLKGTKVQLINGLALLASFFSARLLYGTYMSYNFYTTIIYNRDDIPTPLFWTYTFGNLLLNGLNWFWFSKMVNSVRRRFSTHASTTPSNGFSKHTSPGRAPSPTPNYISGNGDNGTARVTRSSRVGPAHNPRMRAI